MTEQPITMCAFPLGQEGLDYVKHRLNERGLCAKIDRGTLESGEVFAVVPEGTSREQAHAFEAGGRLGMHHSEEWLAGHLRRCLAEAPNATVLVQDVWASATDPAFQTCRRAKFANGDCVYYPMDTKHLIDSEVHEVLKQAMSFYLAGFVCDYSLPPEVLKTHEASDAVIDALARTAVEFFTRAYDLEGFVVWRQRR